MMQAGTRVMVDGKEPGTVISECKTQPGVYNVQRDRLSCPYRFHKSRLVPLQASDGTITITLRMPIEEAAELFLWLKARTTQKDGRHV